MKDPFTSVIKQTSVLHVCSVHTEIKFPVLQGLVDCHTRYMQFNIISRCQETWEVHYVTFAFVQTIIFANAVNEQAK